MVPLMSVTVSYMTWSGANGTPDARDRASAVDSRSRTALTAITLATSPAL